MPGPALGLEAFAGMILSVGFIFFRAILSEIGEVSFSTPFAVAGPFVAFEIRCVLFLCFFHFPADFFRRNPFPCFGDTRPPTVVLSFRDSTFWF